MTNEQNTQKEPDGKPSAKRWGVRGWLSDSALMLGVQAAATIATTILAIVIARSLDPADFGLFAALLSLSQAVAIVVEMGFATFLLREFSGSEWPNDDARSPAVELLSTAVVAALIGTATVLIFTLLVVLAAGVPSATAIVLIALLVNTTLLAVAALVQSVARSQRQLLLVVRVVVVEKFVLLGVTALALRADLGMQGVAFAYAFSAVLHLSLIWWLTGRRFGRLFALPAARSVRQTVRRSLPFVVSRVALNVGPRLDAVVVATVSFVAASSFAIGDRVVGSVLFVPAVLGSTMFPFLSRHSEDRGRYVKLTSGLMLFSGVLMAGIGVAASAWAIPAVFGSDYEPAVATVQLMLLSLPFIFLCNALLAQLYQSAKERVIAWRIVIASLIGLVAVGAGVLLAGSEGAALGFVFRQVLFSILLSRMAIRDFRDRQTVGWNADNQPLQGEI